MTQTNTATRIYSIPPKGLSHQGDGALVTAMWVNGAGWSVQLRVNGEHRSANIYQSDMDAIAAYVALRDQYAAAEPAPEPTVKLAPAAKGTTLRVSDPGHIVLMLAATDPHGIVRQGGHEGQATRTQLAALARRNFLDLIYETGRADSRKVIIGGRITLAGLARLAELDAADAYRARIAAAIAGPARTNANIAA